MNKLIGDDKLIKNCPWCNRNPDGTVDIQGSQKSTGYYWIECSQCHARTENFEARLDACKAWNKGDINNPKEQ